MKENPRYKNAVVLSCHGGPDLTGKWSLEEDNRTIRRTVQEAVDELRLQYPDRPIVVWSCNSNGSSLKGKNVFYFKRQVWSIPTDQLPVTYYSILSHHWVTVSDNSVEGAAGYLSELVEGN